MAKPLTVSFTHELGKAEAVRRITDGIAYLRANYADKLAVINERWTGDRLDFSVSALKQTATGSIDVGEEQVTVTVMLPLLLAVLADKARSLIQKEGQQLLEKK